MTAKTKTLVACGTVAVAAIYIAVPLVVGAAGGNLRATMWARLPVWGTLNIIGWEAAGREGKPRVAANTADEAARRRNTANP